MPEGRTPIRIGSDAEFGLVNFRTGRQVAVCNYYDQSGSGIGLDGHSHIGELRTSGGYVCPLGHVKTLQTYVRELCRTAPLITDVVGGAMVADRDPIGGHIHFAVTKPATEFIGSLDLLVAVPSLMIEDVATSHVRRGECGYGRIRSYERKPYGFEYRVLPSWLVSKGYAEAICSLAFCVTEAIQNGQTLPQFADLGSTAETNFTRGRRSFFRKSIPRIHNQIKGLYLYPKYRLPIDSLFGLIYAFNKTKEKNWREKMDILKRWGLSDTDILGRNKAREEEFKTTQKADSRVLWSMDRNLAAICDVSEIRDFPVGTTILIYGLSSESDCDVYLTGAFDLMSFREYYNFFTLAGDCRSNQWNGNTMTHAIGLSRHIRRNYTTARDVLRLIMGGVLL